VLPSSDPDRGKYSGINPDSISYTYSDIWSGTYPGILSDIFLPFYLTSYLTFLWHAIWYLSRTYSDILSRMSWHRIWQSIWHSIWHFIWQCVQARQPRELASSQTGKQICHDVVGGRLLGVHGWVCVCVCGHVCGRVPPGCLVNLKNLTGGEWSYPTSGSWETSVPNPSVGWSSFLRMAMAFFGGTPHWQTNPVGPEFAHIYAKTNLREMNGEMDLRVCFYGMKNRNWLCQSYRAT